MKVICINDKNLVPNQSIDPVVEGEVYTVIDTCKCLCGCGCTYYEVEEAGDCGNFTVGFEIWRFQPYTTDFLEEIQEYLANTEKNRVTIIKEEKVEI